MTTLDMSDFSSNLPSSKLDSSKKEQLMEQVKAQIAVANAQEILHVSSCVTECNIRSSVVLEVKSKNAGIFVLKTIRSLEHSFPGPFVPENE